MLGGRVQWGRRNPNRSLRVEDIMSFLGARILIYGKIGRGLLPLYGDPHYQHWERGDRGCLPQRTKCEVIPYIRLLHVECITTDGWCHGPMNEPSEPPCLTAFNKESSHSDTPPTASPGTAKTVNESRDSGNARG